MEASKRKPGELSYSLWTAPHDTWKPSLDGVSVYLSPRSESDANAADSTERVKAFETSVDPEVLIRRAY